MSGEVKVTFTAEDKGIAATVRKMGQSLRDFAASSKASSDQLAKEEQAVSKLQTRINGLTKTLADLNKQVGIRKTNGVNDWITRDMENNIDVYTSRLNDARKALDQIKGSARGASSEVGGMVGMFGSLRGVLGGIGAVAGIRKLWGITQAGFQEGTANATQANAALPTLAKFGAGAFATQAKLAKGGMPLAQAADMAGILKQFGMDNAQGQALAKALEQKVENPTGILHGALMAGAAAGISPTKALGLALTASKYNPISTEQALAGFQGQGAIQALRMGTSPEEMAALMGVSSTIPGLDFGGLVETLSSNILAGKGSLLQRFGNLSKVYGRFFKGAANGDAVSTRILDTALGGQAGGMVELYRRMPEITRQIPLMGSESGGALAALAGVETPTSKAQRQLQAAQNMNILADQTAGRADFGFEWDKAMANIGTASKLSGESPVTTWIRQSLASMAGGSAYMFGGSKETVENMLGWGGAGFGGDTKGYGYEQHFFDARNAANHSTDQAGAINIEATHKLTEAITKLTEAIQKTDTRYPVPTPSPNYQSLQPQWQNRQ